MLFYIYKRSQKLIIHLIILIFQFSVPNTYPIETKLQSLVERQFGKQA